MNEQKIAPVLSDDEIINALRPMYQDAVTRETILEVNLMEARAIEQSVLARVGAVREQIIEDAASTCESRSASLGGGQQYGASLEAGKCAAAIRALKGTPAAAVDESVCKGSMALGSGCGKCARCRLENAQLSGNLGQVADAQEVSVLAAALALLVAGGFVTQSKADEAIQIALHTPGCTDLPVNDDAAQPIAQAQPSGNAGELEAAWQGWATQKPGRLPKLWGARHIAELNWDEDGDADLIRLVEVERIAASKEGEPK